MKAILLVFTVATLLLMSPTARASGGFAMNGGGCLLDDASTGIPSRNASFAGLVEFKGTSTGTIRLLCPITPTPFFSTTTGTLSGFGLTYYDSDGNTDTCYVKAWLQTTPFNSPSGATLASYDGTTQFLSGTQPYFVGPVFSIAANFSANYYWVQVDLVRGSTSCTVSLVGLSVST